MNLGTSDLSKAMAWNDQTAGGQEGSDTEGKGAACPDQEIWNKLEYHNPDQQPRQQQTESLAGNPSQGWMHSIKEPLLLTGAPGSQMNAFLRVSINLEKL